MSKLTMARGAARLNAETIVAQQREYNRAIRKYRRALALIRSKCPTRPTPLYPENVMFEIGEIARKALERR